MINRVMTLSEDVNKTPLLSQFPGAHHVSYQDGTIYVVYAPAENNRHWYLALLWRQSPGVYAVFGTQEFVKSISSSAKSLTEYAKQDDHDWRTYECAGTDSSIDPITGEEIGAFNKKIITFDKKPPKEVSEKKPYKEGKLSITEIIPIISSTCGPVDMVDCAKKATDDADDPKEKEKVKVKVKIKTKELK
jgi:hypothetical protein